MKKWLLSIFIGFIVLTGCTTNEEDVSTEITNPIDVEMIISLDNDTERIVDETLTVNDGAILIDVLTENYDIDKTSEGFINAIEGHEQNDPTYWFFDVNGAPSEVGAADVELSDGDIIHFDFHEYEG